MKVCCNGKQKLNKAVTLFQYVLQMYHKKLVKKRGLDMQSIYIIFPYVVRTHQ